MAIPNLNLLLLEVYACCADSGLKPPMAMENISRFANSAMMNAIRVESFGSRHGRKKAKNIGIARSPYAKDAS
jgi:hypothetical protein